MNGGETNYISATLAVYLDRRYVFVSLLNLLMAFQRRARLSNFSQQKGGPGRLFFARWAGCSDQKDCRGHLAALGGENVEGAAGGAGVHHFQPGAGGHQRLQQCR